MASAKGLDTIACAFANLWFPANILVTHVE
jgi:hypothetical protein